MTARIDLFAPATITAFASGASSLGVQPGHGVFVNDPGGGTIVMTLTAANAAALLSASSLGGAIIASHANTLTISGLAAQVNAALRTLEVSEAAGAARDTISLSATEAGELAASTAMAVNVASTVGPAFIAPPGSVALAAWSLEAVPGLVIGDAEVNALIAAGEGAAETLQLTLAVASGVLLMPGFSAASGIAASGIGTGTVLLTFTGDQLAAVNLLLGGLSFAGPAGLSGLAYGLRNLSGPLGGAVTSGNIALGVTGAVGAPRTVSSGADTVILGVETLGPGTLTVASVTSDLGGIAGLASLRIEPGAAFEMPYNTLNLGGTSFDEGGLGVLALNSSGTLVVAGTAVVGNVVNIGSAGVVDVSGTLIGAAQAQVAYQEGFSVAAGGLILGDGALVAGNFSNAGRIFGPGTIEAAGGGTLLISAAEISGGAQLQVGAGGVLELGAISPLFGVFDATPLTIDAGVTLQFGGENGPDAVTGPFTDNLDQRGGVIVINSPDVFAGTIVNFQPGDRLIFPGLTGLTLLSITSHSFVVAGIDGNDNTVDYTINAAYQAGTGPFVYTDAAGDSDVGLRDTQVDVFLGSSLAASGQIEARPGVTQPIQGLDVLLRSWTTQSLVLTLSVAAGVLSDGTSGPVASLTLTAASPAALDAALAGLNYTANGNATVDELQITAVSGWLNGASAGVPIELNTAAGTVGGFGDAGQVALFDGGFIGPLLSPATPGEMLVTGIADFADALDVGGLSGTALRVDAGGIALFDAAAAVEIGSAATIGDAGGAGFLGIFSEYFSAAGNIVIGGNAAAAGSEADIAGALTIAGTLAIGAAAVSDVYVDGVLAAAAVSIGGSGTLAGSGFGGLTLGALTDSGVFILLDRATASANAAKAAGTLVLDGSSVFTVQNGMTATGLLIVGADAHLTAGSFSETGGSMRLAGVLTAAGVTSTGTISLAGGTIVTGGLSLSGATLAGFGDIEAATSLASIAMSSATIDATGFLDIGGDVAMSGASKILLGSLSAVELGHAVTGGVISFGGAGAVLTIDDLQKFTAPVANMLAHDAIDLVGVAPGLVTFAGGSITATDAQANRIGGFSLGVAGGQPAVQIGSDGNGGTMITLGGDIPCFARGTGILTPSGYRSVEDLAPGDAVITAGGVVRPVRWIGHRTLDLGGDAGDRPIRFAAGAIAPGVPARPVKLSPLHAVFFDGVLVPALHLVNGATIRQMPAGAVTYYHIELDRHDIVVADGMPAESFIENGNRGQLFRENGVRVGCKTACARLVTSGAELGRIRRRLHRIALEAGYTLTYDAGIRGVAGRAALLPAVTMQREHRIVRFSLPQGVPKLAITARACSPAETDPDSEDRRVLGICLAAASDGVATGAGWLPRANTDKGTWMPAMAELLLTGGFAEVTLDLAAIAQTWRAPPQVRAD